MADETVSCVYLLPTRNFTVCEKGCRMSDTITTVYDPKNGKLEYEFVRHADGSTQVWEWDTENQYSWSVEVWDATAAKQDTDVYVTNDDGTL